MSVVVKDVVERVVSTFVQGALAVVIALGFNWASLTDPTWRSAVVAGGVAAVLSLVKAWLATRIGRRGASLAPSVGAE